MWRERHIGPEWVTPCCGYVPRQIGAHRYVCPECGIIHESAREAVRDVLGAAIRPPVDQSPQFIPTPDGPAQPRLPGF